MSNASTRNVLLTLALIFAGVAAGVFVGAELFGSADQPGGSENDHVPPLTSATRFLTVGIGDTFPFAGFRDSSGLEPTPRQLLGDKGTILMFVGPGCGACLDLLELWQEEAGSLISDEVSLFACVPQAEEVQSPEFDQLLASHKVVRFDATQLAQEINLSFWPTTIGVDSNGKISFAVEGFSSDIVYRLAAWQNELK